MEDGTDWTGNLRSKEQGQRNKVRMTFARKVLLAHPISKHELACWLPQLEDVEPRKC